MDLGFSAEKYIDLQSKHILERINKGNGQRLYLEFGGKLVHDKHAMRVLPGFDENAKIKLLQKLKDKAEIIICVYAGDIAVNKTRQDFGITYDLEVMRLIDIFRKYDLSVNSVVVTRYEENSSVDTFITKLERRGIKTYKHYFTKGYPVDVDIIVSEEGYGANPYIETTKPLCVVTGPGGGSGKLATCLSQLYHENKRGNNARYAKFETFPVWNLPLKHPVNVAYEAATADLKDVNMIDSFHLDAYGEMAVNYNRDIEVFPVVKRILEKITGGECEYKSPTDMGVNMVGYAITDDEVCQNASKQEIIRRELIGLCDFKKGKIDKDILERVRLLMEEVNSKIGDRKVVGIAREYLEEIEARKDSRTANADNNVVMSIELPNGEFVRGRSSDVQIAPASALLNAVKRLANMDDSLHLISPMVISRIQDLKKNTLLQESYSLNIEEILNALVVCASTNPSAELAASKLKLLRGCKAHCTAILNSKDEQILRSLGIDVTCDPEYSSNNLYFR
ncbi:MAG: DUF1846 domain-containing protein [Eubacteriales bacterium]|nr:DUF1846 domain-containing protein [Eubacteriales bacterium]MDY3332542.1 DUF1846 domain-containing protein [Gallibacter sp.]